jgi:O-antigen ligase
MTESSRPESLSIAALEPFAYERKLSLVTLVQGLILLLLTANLGRIPVVSAGESSAPLLINDVAVAVVVLLGLVAGLATRSFRIDRPGLIGLLFAAIGATSAFATARSYGFATFELALSLAYLARWLLYFAVYLVLINVVKRRDVRGVWSAVETVLLIFAAFGVVQAVFLPGFAQLVYPESRAYLDWDIQGHRLVSTVLEPNIAAAMLLLGLLVQLAQISVGVRVPRWRPLLLFLALVLTLSRSGALGLAAGVATILLVRGLSKRLLRWILVVSALVLVALPKLVTFAAAYGKFSTGGSAAARVLSWVQALRVFRDHPVFGIGFNTFGFVQERYGYVRFGTAAYSSDGGLLFIAVLTGVVGVSVYVWMLSSIMRRCRTIWRDHAIPAEHRGLAIGTAAVIVGLCFDSVFVNSLLTTFVMEPFWILCALTLPIVGERRTSAPNHPPVVAAFARGLVLPSRS